MAEIKHWSHVHLLKLIERPDYPYYCSCCNQLGFGATYNCSSCNFFLHTECATASPLADHPFSQKCKFELRHAITGHHAFSIPCDACGKTVRGLHYKCICAVQKRYLHPFCLKYNHSLEANSDGLTLSLSKTATSRCLHCHKKDLGWSVSGWAYVSACGNYCYHVACVRDIINENWRNGFITGECDPFLSVKESIPKMDKLYQIVKARKVKASLKKATTALSIIFHALTGNPAGLVGVAVQFFAPN